MSVSTAMEPAHRAKGPGPTRAAPLRLVDPAVVSIVGFVTLWWLASLGQPPYILPSPVAILDAFVRVAFETGELWLALGQTLVALLIGGALSLAVGVPLGMLMGSRKRVERAFEMYVSALYVAPVSALTPLFIYWLGVDLAPRVATIFVFATPQVVITCYRGAQNVQGTYMEVARAFRANERQKFAKVLLPHELPYIVTAMRLGLGQAIKGAVLAELLVSSTGLGLLLSGFSQRFDTASLIAVLFTLMFVGILSTGVIARVERALTPWSTRT